MSRASNSQGNIVIFDTNAYRNLVSKKSLAQINLEIANLKEQENKLGIKPNICPVVAWELVLHLLDDPTSHHYQSCLKSCLAMVDHCTSSDGRIHYLSNPFSHVGHFAFGEISDSTKNAEKLLVGLLSQIAKNPIQQTIQQNKSILNLIKQLVENAEQSFIGSIGEMLKHIDPAISSWMVYQFNKIQRDKFKEFINSEEFKEIASYSFINEVAKDLNLTKFPIKILNQFILRYSIPIDFRREIMLKFTNCDYDLKKKSRANSALDELILYYPWINEDGSGITLVTDDTAMQDSAKRCTDIKLIYKLEEYMNFVSASLRGEELQYKPEEPITCVLSKI